MRKVSRVYCAGPLFNEAERTEMASIARELENAGFRTFLPHRDGFELAKLAPAVAMKLGGALPKAQELLGRAIFALDLCQVLAADAVVANLNGRVPDEGTIVEATIGCCHRKTIVLYKTDARSLLNGTDNPMLVGLSNFSVVSQLDQIVPALQDEPVHPQSEYLDRMQALGASIALGRSQANDEEEVAKLLVSILGDYYTR